MAGLKDFKKPSKIRSTFAAAKGIFMIILLLYVSLLMITIVYGLTFSRHHGVIWGVAGIWFILSYYTIPRIHRRLTKLYLPDYYIGRTRTGDGLLGDPVNIAFHGTKRDLLQAMQTAGWVRADDLNWRSTLKMITRSLTHESYPHAPVSSLLLFGQKQAFAFQQEVGGTTSKRHHIRFWKTPKGWYLPGGFKSDWLAAATYDRRVGLSAFTFQITHKIEADIDKERDHVLKTLRSTGYVSKVYIRKNFSSSYHDRNGGGDFIETDGDMPFITIRKPMRDKSKL